MGRSPRGIRRLAPGRERDGGCARRALRRAARALQGPEGHHVHRRPPAEPVRQSAQARAQTRRVSESHWYPPGARAWHPMFEGDFVVPRLVQWTTGNVGKESVKAIVANPGLELVGCYAWTESKDGVDVGELVGIDPLGVAATSDVEALLGLRPDCVVYNPMWPSTDELVRILEAGVNVVTT